MRKIKNVQLFRAGDFAIGGELFSVKVDDNFFVGSCKIGAEHGTLYKGRWRSDDRGMLRKVV
jgi:hypothetical protein